MIARLYDRLIDHANYEDHARRPIVWGHEITSASEDYKEEFIGIDFESKHQYTYETYLCVVCGAEYIFRCANCKARATCKAYTGSYYCGVDHQKRK